MKKAAYIGLSGVNPKYRTFMTENATIQKVKSFKKLKKGWHYGEGVSFNDKNINCAIDLCEFLLNNSFIKIDAFPGFNGEIRITAYPSDYYFEMTLDGNENVSLLIEKNGNDQEIFRIENHNCESIKKLIIEKRDSLLWNTPEYLHYITTTAPENDSTVLRLGTPHQNLEAEFQSMISNVRTNLQVASVNIYALNSQNEPIRQFSGNLKGRYSQPAE
jgi:hypothetical protein